MGDWADVLAEKWLEPGPIHNTCGDRQDSLAALLRRVAEEAREWAAKACDEREDHHRNKAHGAGQYIRPVPREMEYATVARECGMVVRALSLEGLAAGEREGDRE